MRVPSWAKAAGITAALPIVTLLIVGLCIRIAEGWVGASIPGDAKQALSIAPTLLMTFIGSLVAWTNQEDL